MEGLLLEVMRDYPIGAEVWIKDDNPGTVHVVYGYEWFGHGGNLIFRDGTKLNMHKRELIDRAVKEVAG